MHVGGENESVEIVGALVLITGLVFVVASLGCDKATNFINNDVSLVKNGILEFDKSLTIGQALDKYKYFKSTKWEAIKTDNGRRVVNMVGDLDTSTYPYLIKNNNHEIKSAYLQFQFVINQDKSIELKWCGLGDEKISGEKRIPDENASLLMCMNTLKEVYNNEPKEASAEEKAAFRAEQK